MKYLCLVYRDEKTWDALSEREYSAIVSETLTYREELRASGHFIASDALHTVESTTTIRVRNGNVSVVDGPAAATTEQLGGFYLIDAGDLNEAIRVASKIPSARLASIEVRPINEITPA